MITVPILVLSPLIQEIPGFTLSIPGTSYMLFALSSFVFFYGGWPFLQGLVDEFGEKRPGMMAKRPPTLPNDRIFIISFLL